MRNSMPLRACVVGAGLMGRWHADAVTRAGHIVTAIVDPDRARAQALAVQFDVPTVVSTVEEIPSDVRLDIAHVCAPIGMHAALTRSALRRGMHVLVEKPLAEDAPATEALLGDGAEAGRMVVPVHQFLFQPGVLRLMEIVRQHGSPLHLDFVACTAGAIGAGAADRDEVAGSILPHGLSLARRLVAQAPLADAGWTVIRPVPGELRCSAQLGEATVSLLVSTDGRPPVNALRAIFKDRTVEVDLYHGYSVIIRGSTGRGFKIRRPFVSALATITAATANGARRALRREAAYPGLRELVARLYTAVANGGDAPISAAETLDVARARHVILGMAAGTAPERA